LKLKTSHFRPVSRHFPKNTYPLVDYSNYFFTFALQLFIHLISTTRYMPVKLRLRRQGRKGIPYFHIVASDSRSPRDGKFLEQVGVYDPSRIPAHIVVDHAKALKWLNDGAQPTDTVRAIFRYAGVNLKFALAKQGKSPEVIDTIFNKWWEERMARVNAKISTVTESKSAVAKAAFEHETKIRLEKAAKIAARNNAAIEAAAAAAAPPAPEVKEEAPAAEEAIAPAVEEATPPATEETTKE
jgi:small subunit ribosomal protein S16